MVYSPTEKQKALKTILKWRQEVKSLLQRYKTLGDREALAEILKTLEWPYREERRSCCRLANIDERELFRYTEVHRSFLFY